jgi:CheY-like chemotaxis protein
MSVLTATPGAAPADDDPPDTGERHRLTAVTGLAALSLDAMASVAYGPEAIVLVLAAAGAHGLGFTLPVTLAIAGLLAVLVASCRQVIAAFPDGGGSYAVARHAEGLRLRMQRPHRRRGPRQRRAVLPRPAREAGQRAEVALGAVLGAMQARGYGVDAAPDGTTALRIAAASRPDVVLLDLGLPDMDGTEVIRALRGWTRVPVLVLSARRAFDEKVAALDAGAGDYITKPFSMDELLARLRAAVRRTRSPDPAHPRHLITEPGMGYRFEA